MPCTRVVQRESRGGSGTRDKVEELQKFAVKRGPSLMLRSLGRCGGTEGLVFLPLQQVKMFMIYFWHSIPKVHRFLILYAFDC